MRIYTDVEITAAVEGYDLTLMQELYVTFKQGPVEVDIPIDLSTVTSTTFQFIVPQEKTSEFAPDMDVEAILNYVNEDGLHKASTIAVIGTEDNLRRKFMYGT